MQTVVGVDEEALEIVLEQLLVALGHRDDASERDCLDFAVTSEQADEGLGHGRDFAARRHIVVQLGGGHDDGRVATLEEGLGVLEQELVVRVHFEFGVVQGLVELGVVVVVAVIIAVCPEIGNLVICI